MGHMRRTDGGGLPPDGGGYRTVRPGPDAGPRLLRAACAGGPLVASRPMVDVNSPCLACGIVREEVRPVGGVLAREAGLVLHGVASASPLPGWLVITSEAHVRGLWDVPGEAARALGPLAARAMRAQREVLGAEHVYAFSLGDVLHHFHLHLVPRFADTPAHLRGRGAFDARPQEALEPEVLEAAAAVLSRALAR